MRGLLLGPSPSPPVAVSLAVHLMPELPYPTTHTPKHVRFPCPYASPELFASSHETWSQAEYDRTPIEPPSEEERSCKLPGRGERQCVLPEDCEDENEDEEADPLESDNDDDETASDDSDDECSRRKETFAAFMSSGGALKLAPSPNQKRSPPTPQPTRRHSTSEDCESPTTSRRILWLQSQAENLPSALKERLLALSGVGCAESSSEDSASSGHQLEEDEEFHEEDDETFAPCSGFSVTSASPICVDLAPPFAFHHPSSSLPLPTRVASTSASSCPDSPTTSRRLLWLQSQADNLPDTLRSRLMALTMDGNDDCLSPTDPPFGGGAYVPAQASSCLFPVASSSTSSLSSSYTFHRPAQPRSCDDEDELFPADDDLSSTYEAPRPGRTLLTSRALLASGGSSSSISTLLQIDTRTLSPSPDRRQGSVDSAASYSTDEETGSSAYSYTSSCADSADTSLESLTSEEFLGRATFASPTEGMSPDMSPPANRPPLWCGSGGAAGGIGGGGGWEGLAGTEHGVRGLSIKAWAAEPAVTTARSSSF